MGMEKQQNRQVSFDLGMDKAAAKPLISKEAVQRISQVVMDADAEYQDDMDVDSLLAKHAQLHQLPPAHSDILAHSWNIASQNGQRMLGKTAEEKFAPFPTASGPGIRSHLLPGDGPSIKSAAWRDLPKPVSATAGRGAVFSKQAAVATPKVIEVPRQDGLPLAIKAAEKSYRDLWEAAEDYRDDFRSVREFFHHKTAARHNGFGLEDYAAVLPQHRPIFQLLASFSGQTLPPEPRLTVKAASHLRIDPSETPIRQLRQLVTGADRLFDSSTDFLDKIAAVNLEADRQVTEKAARFGIDLSPEPVETHDYLFADQVPAPGPAKTLSWRDAPGQLKQGVVNSLGNCVGGAIDTDSQESLLARVLGAELAKMATELTTRLSGQEKSARLHPPVPKEEPIYPFDEAAPAETGAAFGDSYADFWTGLPAVEAEKLAGFGAGMSFGAGMESVRNLAHSIAPPVPELTGKMMDRIQDPSVALEQRRVQAQTLLADLMSNDDVISTYDPEQVIRAYNEMSSLTPHTSLRSAVVRPALRQMLAGNTQPFDVAELLSLENKYQNRSEFPTGGAGAKPEPGRPSFNR